MKLSLDAQLQTLQCGAVCNHWVINERGSPRRGKGECRYEMDGPSVNKGSSVAARLWGSRRERGWDELAAGKLRGDSLGDLGEFRKERTAEWAFCVQPTDLKHTQQGGGCCRWGMWRVECRLCRSVGLKDLMGPGEGFVESNNNLCSDCDHDQASTARSSYQATHLPTRSVRTHFCFLAHSPTCVLVRTSLWPCPAPCSSVEH